MGVVDVVCSSTEHSEAPGAVPHNSRFRFVAGRRGLVLLLFFTATASYLCRVNLSIVGALMMRELNFSQVDMGRIFSAFVVGYALFQIPTGALADRWGARRVLACAAFSWALVTLAIAGLRSWHALPISGFSSLLVLRFLLGVGEAPTFPAAAQGVARWVDKLYRGTANGVVLAAIGAGSAIAPIILSRAMVQWGWRQALAFSALPALAVAAAWTCLREPCVTSGMESIPAVANAAKWKPVSRSFVLLVISYSLEGYVGYIFVFWFYLYLVQVRHFDLLRAGGLSSLPWFMSIVSIPLGGVISDWLIKGRLGPIWGRRTVPMFGLLASAICIFWGARTQHAYTAVACLSVATAAVLSVEGPFWAAMMQLSGRHSGTAGGVMNLGSNIGGLISPALTPVLAVSIGWTNALYVAAVIAAIAAALWLGISPDAQLEN